MSWRESEFALGGAIPLCATQTNSSTRSSLIISTEVCHISLSMELEVYIRRQGPLKERNRPESQRKVNEKVRPRWLATDLVLPSHEGGSAIHHNE